MRYKFLSVQLTEQESSIYVKRYPESARRHKTISVQLTEQDLVINAKCHPDCARLHKFFLCS
jgi:hypothetical protein